MMKFKFDGGNKVPFTMLPISGTFTDRGTFDDDRVLMRISIYGYDCEVKRDDEDDKISGAAVDLENGEIYLYAQDALVVPVDCDVIAHYK